jgi:2-dehydropantoate 2-reductase
VKNQISRAPRPLLTIILRAASSGKYRQTLGGSAEECRGLIDLLAAEGRRQPELRAAPDALLALRPAEAGSPRTARPTRA